MLIKYIGGSESQINFGRGNDPRGVLRVGYVYKLKSKEIHSWHTVFTLEEFPDKQYNSVLFCAVPGGEEEYERLWDKKK